RGGGDGSRRSVRRREHGAEGPRRNRLRAPHGRARGHHGARSRRGRGTRRSRNDHHSGDGVNIHEYQAKDILRAEGVPIPPGEVATTPDEVEAIAKKIGGMVVVKAQVHTGGRGKAGGVKLAKTPAEAKEIASRILGMT